MGVWARRVCGWRGGGSMSVVNNGGHSGRVSPALSGVCPGCRARSEVLACALAWARRWGPGWCTRHASMQVCAYRDGAEAHARDTCRGRPGLCAFFCPFTYSLVRYAHGTPAHDGDGGGGGAGRPSHNNKEVKLDELSKYFHLPEKAVAKELGICLTSLKKLCRFFLPDLSALSLRQTHTRTHTHQARRICLVT